MDLPQGLNPELIAQMLGGPMGGGPLGASMGSASPDDAMAEEEEEDDDGVDRTRWKILYPAYLNKKYSIAKGRRVNLLIAVEDPTVEEMKLICDHLSVPARIEIVSHSYSIRAKIDGTDVPSDSQIEDPLRAITSAGNHRSNSSGNTPSSMISSSGNNSSSSSVGWQKQMHSVLAAAAAA
ncbi:hypothetical protein ACSSS7_001055 [Eimeria intestinalis]